jgi:chemotaxis protein histidine kinase CheA
MDKERFAREMAELTARYARDVRERLDALEALWRRMMDQADPSLLPEVHRRAHKLAGTGATFGFPGVGQAARALERGLQPFIQGDAARLPSGAEARELEGLLHGLRQALEASLPEDGRA